MNKQEKIKHNGSLSTKTDFTLSTGKKIRIEVWLSTEATSANTATFYNTNLYTKGKSCRNWVYQFRAKYPTDRRIYEYITEDQLYTAYYNHWVKINPFRYFAQGSFNSELVSFSVEEKPQIIKHMQF